MTPSFACTYIMIFLGTIWTYMGVYGILWYFKVSARLKLPMVRNNDAMVGFFIWLSLLTLLGGFEYMIMLRDPTKYPIASFVMCVCSTVLLVLAVIIPHTIKVLTDIRNNLPER